MLVLFGVATSQRLHDYNAALVVNLPTGKKT
jgi:hypothetical protein